MDFRIGQISHLLDPTWEHNCIKGLSVELGDLMWCAVSHFWSVCQIFFLWTLRRLTVWPCLSWSGCTAKGGPTKEKAIARHTPLHPLQGQFGAEAYFRYAGTLRRRIHSVRYVGCLRWLGWVICLNLEKGIFINKMFSFLVSWDSLRD